MDNIVPVLPGEDLILWKYCVQVGKELLVFLGQFWVEGPANGSIQHPVIIACELQHRKASCLQDAGVDGCYILSQRKSFWHLVDFFRQQLSPDAGSPEGRVNPKREKLSGRKKPRHHLCPDGFLVIEPSRNVLLRLRLYPILIIRIPGQDHIRMTAVNLVNQPRQLALRQPIITVHTPDIFTGAVLCPSFPGRHDSAVFLVDHLYKGIPFGVATRNGRGSICRAVVHHDDFGLCGRLFNDAIQAAVDVFFGVVHRDNDADEHRGDLHPLLILSNKPVVGHSLRPSRVPPQM